MKKIKGMEKAEDEKDANPFEPAPHGLQRTPFRLKKEYYADYATAFK